MKNFKNGVLNIPQDAKVEIIGLPTIEIDVARYEDLIYKEAQLDFVKKLVANKNDYVDITDLKLLLDVEKAEGTKDEQ